MKKTSLQEALNRLNREIVSCRRCPRLVAYREAVAREKRRAYRHEVYWGRPVPGFGDPEARILVVGLAPAAHGANRTGRMFTGDSSGRFLIQRLYEAGLANQPDSVHRWDQLELRDVYLTAVVRCAPPGNKPTRQEILNCLPYLDRELDLLPRLRVVLTLGQIAHRGYLQVLRHRGIVQRFSAYPFRHHAVYEIPGAPVRWLVTAYHPSRQNTQTGRLTPEMFRSVLETVLRLARQ